MKRIVDLLVTLGLMLILAPLFLLLVLAIMLPSVGSVLFRTQRVGKVNKLFALYKFRTMRMDTAQVATYLLREPDQFLTYMQAGLPILTRINQGTDLANIINGEGVGRTYTGNSVEELRAIAEQLVDDPKGRQLMALCGRALSDRIFSPTRAVNQIIGAICAAAK